MKGYKDHDRSPERREYLIPVAQTFRPEVCSRHEVAAVGGSFLLPSLRMGWSMSVAWTRISSPSTNKPVRSSGSLLAKVRWHLLRRWQAGSSSYDGKFYAIHAATGQLEWTFETAGERRYAGRHLHGLFPAAETMPDPWNYFLSSPAVWTVPWISEAAMATCMPWTPCRAA